MNEFLQMLVENSPNKLWLLPKKCLYIISLNKKIKWSKFLFTSLLKAKVNILKLNKAPSCLFEKFNWKFRINFREFITKSTCEFLKLAN